MYWGGYSYLDIVQEVFMKRTIIAVISIVLIAFAFTACRQSVVIPFDPVPSNPNTPVTPTPDPSVESVDSYDGLRAALIDPDVKTVELEADLNLTPDEVKELEFSKTGLVIDGKGKTITIVPTTSKTASVLSAVAREGEPTTSHVFEINSDNVTFKDMNFVVEDPSLRTWLINVNKNGFTYDGGSITGVINGTYSTVDMGIVIASGTTGTTIKDVTFKGNFTPVTATSPDFTIDGAIFESGMIFENSDPVKTVVKNCKHLDNADWRATIDLYTVESGYSSTTSENAIAVRSAILSEENNNTDVSVTINGQTAGKLSVWNSNEPGSWYTTTGSTDASEMKLSISFDNGTMTAKVDGNEIYSYQLGDGETESKIGRIILQSENDGEEYSVNWTLPVITSGETSVEVPTSDEDWITDRTEPKDFSINGNSVTVTTTSADLDDFYRYQGNVASIEMEASSSWEVSTTLSFDDSLYATGFSPSIWLDVENAEGTDIDWAIIKLESNFAE